MKYKFLITGALVLAELALCGGMVLSVTNIGAMVSMPSSIFTNRWMWFSNPNYSATSEEEKRFTVNTPAKLQMNSGVGKIDVVGGSGKEIVVSARKKAYGATQADADAALAAMKVTMTQDGDTVTVDVTPQNTVNRAQFSDNVQFTVTVPEETAVNVVSTFGDIKLAKTKGNVDLKTSAGEVRVSDVQGNVTIQSDFGEIRLENITTETLSAKSNAGSIRLTQVTAKDAVTVRTDFGNMVLERVTAKSYDLKTNAGKIEMTGAQGAVKVQNDFGSIVINDGDKVQLDLKSNNGAIRYAGSLGDGPHNVRTDFGSITLILPKDSALNASLKTDFGSIKSDLPISLSGTQSRTSWEGTTNGGGASLTAKTNNGSIAIEILK